MRGFLIRTIVSALALGAAAWLLPGITLGEGEATTGRRIGTALVVAIVFGVINAIIKPIVTVLSFPLILLTLGLFTFVINAAMLWLLSWFSGKADLAFHVDKFWWTAIWGALIVSVVTMIANAFLPERDEVH